MLELGETAEQAHREVGLAAAARRGRRGRGRSVRLRHGIARRRATTPTGRATRSLTAGRDEALAWVRENVVRGRRRAGEGLTRRRARAHRRRTDWKDRRRESHPVRRRTGPADLAARHPGRDQRPDPDHGYGQEIRDDGPTSHHTKRGTPTMGGVVDHPGRRPRLLRGQGDQPGPARRPRRCCCSSSSSGCGLVGFLDDFIKIVKQRSLGLRSKAKMIGLTVVAVVFGDPGPVAGAGGRPRRDPGVAAHLLHPRLRAGRLPTVVVGAADLADRRRHQQRREPRRRPRRTARPEPA